MHFVLYAILGLLTARALRRARGDGHARPPLGSLLPWLVGMVLFAAADEWHQRWIPGRSSGVTDWIADVAGGTLALLVAARPVPRPEHLT